MTRLAGLMLLLRGSDPGKEHCVTSRRPSASGSPPSALVWLPDAAVLEKIQLFIEPFRATANPRLLQLLQPLPAMTLGVELLSAIGDGLAAIDRF